MKFKTTKRDIMGKFDEIIRIGYEDALYLLNFINPIAYTTRAEGWAADIYQIGSVAIVTGYAPFGTIKPTYETTRRYEDEAEAIVCDYSIHWEVQREKVAALLKSYIDEVTKKEEE